MSTDQLPVDKPAKASKSDQQELSSFGDNSKPGVFSCLPPRIAPVGQEDPVAAVAPGATGKPQLVLSSQMQLKDRSSKDSADSPVSAATSATSDEVTFAHISNNVFGDNPHCIRHTSNVPHPNTAHKSQLVNATCTTVQRELFIYLTRIDEVLLGDQDLKLDVFISSLQLEDVLYLPSSIEAPLYVLKRAQLERIYSLVTRHGKKHLNNTVLEQALKSVGISTHLLKRLNNVDCPRKWWNCIKEEAETFDVMCFAQALGVTWHPEDFTSVLRELCTLLSRRGVKHIAKSQVVHALFQAKAKLEIIDAVITHGKQLDDLPTLCILTTVSKGLLEGWEKLWIEIGNSFGGASNIPVHSLPTKGRNEGEVLHCMGVWLAYRAETTAPVTWKQLGGILKNAGLLQVFSQLEALSGRNLDDATGTKQQSENTKDPSLESCDSSPFLAQLKNISIPTNMSASNTPSKPYNTMVQSRIANEKAILERPLLEGEPGQSQTVTSTSAEMEVLDPKNPKSVLIHAKAIYLSADYPKTREVLSFLDHQLFLDQETSCARSFGVAISYYKEKMFEIAYENFSGLEKMSIQFNSQGNEALACMYKGEINLVLKETDQAVSMFEKALAKYSETNVAHYFGIIIISKCSIAVKLGNCYRSLSNFEMAKKLLLTAIDLTVKAKQEANGLPDSNPKKKIRVVQTIKEEIAVYHTLGNVYQEQFDFENSHKIYKKALDLQKSLNDPLAFGWANGNYGNALLGLNLAEEALPYLQKALNAATKYERSLTSIGKAAANLGNALMLLKQYDEAKIYFEMAYGHAVFCDDKVAQVKVLSFLSTAASSLGDHFGTLKCLNEMLQISSDDQAKLDLLQKRAELYLLLAVQVNKELAEWIEVPSIVAEIEPPEYQTVFSPVQESKPLLSFTHSSLVAPGGKFKLPTSAENPTENKKMCYDIQEKERDVKSPKTNSSSTTPSDQKHLNYCKYYLLRAKADAEDVIKLVTNQSTTAKSSKASKGKLDSVSKLLQELNVKAHCTLLQVSVLLGEKQNALLVAEVDRAKDLRDILWQKLPDKPTGKVSPSIDLASIWECVQKEKSVVIFFSFVSDVMLVHTFFPNSVITDKGQNESLSVSPLPQEKYQFTIIPLPVTLFTGKSSMDKVTFKQYITKNLTDYLNQNEFDLFEPISLKEKPTPLTVLYDCLVKKVFQCIEQKVPGVSDVVIIPDQTVGLLPWAMLQNQSTWHFLGDFYRIRLYPSISTMGIMNSQAQSVITFPSEERFLVVGNPSIPRITLNGREVSLGRLPHAESEALQVAHFLETQAVVKEQATKSTVLYRLQLANVVHIATHSSGSEGYLAFAANVPRSSQKHTIDASNALLFVSEIQNLQISASLVVLSACDSARVQMVNSDINSLAKAVLAAGAKSVLVSLFRVPDKSASVFMSFFYRFLAHDGYSTSKALQKSSMGIRCIRQFSQHVHWGSFQLFGQDIAIVYDQNCDSAKVSKNISEPSPFPRLDIIKKINFAIFREDRQPPSDVVVVKGLSPYDPAEVVRDFICKHFHYFPGGVFWINCASKESIRRALQSVEEAKSHFVTLQMQPPEVPKRKQGSAKLEVGVNHEHHFRLYVLDHPSSLEDVESLVSDLRHPQTDIIVIGSHDMDYDALHRLVDSNLIRGCTEVVVDYLDSYSVIQRLSYSLLKSTEMFAPLKQDIEAFHLICRVCKGCPSLVKVFEGMLSLHDSCSTFSLSQLAEDIIQLDHFQKVSDAIQEQSGVCFPPDSVKKDRKDKRIKQSNTSVPKKHGHSLPQLKATSLSSIQQSIDFKISESSFSALYNFFELKLLAHELFFIQCLSYVGLQPNLVTEASFTYPEVFISKLADKIASSAKIENSPTKGCDLICKLLDTKLIRVYPQVVVWPAESHSSSQKLFYVPDMIQRIVTFNMDTADRTFVLTVMTKCIQSIQSAPANQSASCSYNLNDIYNSIETLKRNYYDHLAKTLTSH